MRKNLLLILTFGVALVGAARADVHPSLQRGFAAGQVNQVGDVDHINLFSGSLGLTIPLGTYPVTSRFSYSLTLVYNNTVWDYESDGTYTRAVPVRSANAGLGWRLSLGELLPANSTTNDCGPWCYVSPDGGQHVWYKTLHEGDPEDVGDSPSSQATLYTRDGSYLRLRRIVAKTDPVLVYEWEVDFPDGQIHRFDDRGQLTSMRDVFGDLVTGRNVVWVTPTSDAQGVYTQISDPYGRVQKVRVSAVPNYGSIINSVELTAFGGKTAVYTFGYTYAAVSRPCRDTDPATSATVTVPLLTEVRIPDQAGVADRSTYAMPTTDYYLDAAAGCNTAGMIKGLTLPTRGRVEWTYRSYSFPSDAGEKPWRTSNAGIWTRILRDEAGTQVARWTYTPTNNTAGTGSSLREALRTVVGPLGDKTEYFFSVALDYSTSDWSRYDYALPFSRVEAAAGAPNRFRSIKTYDCDAGATSCMLKRTSYVTYERDNGSTSLSLTDDINRNRRSSGERTLYNDDGTVYADVASSTFDGLGHYRTVATSGTFDAGNSRTTTTSFNLARGTYPGSFSQVPPGSAWVLGTFADQTTTEGTTARVQTCFDSATGFLLRRRVLKKGTTPGAQDVVARFTADANGNVRTEEWFGGDRAGQGVNTSSDLCALPLSASQVTTTNTYQGGVLATSRRVSTFLDLDTTIDVRSGLVSSSRDSALVQTAYDYDEMGRLLSSKPAQDAWTTYGYPPVGTGTARVSIQAWKNGTTSGGTNLLTSAEVTYDGFGRVTRERRRMPDQTWAKRLTKFNGLGWQTSVSEWVADTLADASVPVTSYSGHDAFGRPAAITPADGTAHAITLGYKGVRELTRTSSVATGGSGGETASATTEIYDRQGRLYQVLEPANPGGSNTTTTYTYDVGGRLSRVDQLTSAGSQSRTFTYDNRGFLTQECHPEKGALGGGCVGYEGYNARGQTSRRTDGPNDLCFYFDTAERLTDVKQLVSTCQGTDAKPLKHYAYGTGTGAANRSLGKVTVADRYNYVTIDGTPAGTPFTILIRETYTYGADGGRVSSRTTEELFNGEATASESFAQTFAYDDLGNTTTVGYPYCTGSDVGCTNAAAAQRNVTSTYQDGRLKSIAGYAQAFYYFPNGLIDNLVHSNQTRDGNKSDPNSMLRPSEVFTKNNSTNADLWRSGTYTYDGSGNISSIGGGYFKYDKVSRLLSGTVNTTALATAAVFKTQSATYDGFGNIQTLTTNGVAVNTPTAASTNRLTSASYDAAGNVYQFSGATYLYDPFDNMWSYKNGAEAWLYLYTADDERIWSFKVGANPRKDVFTLRDLGGRVLRQFDVSGYDWNNSVTKDYVYRDGLLLASVSSNATEGVRHFHLDHLGTPRLVTNATGGAVAFHSYYPFGAEATAFNLDTERMKFTGHERDLNSLAGAGDDLDYMHARHYSPVSARFLSTDPVRAGTSHPQQMNRYAYVNGRPMTYLDPSGAFGFPWVMWENAFTIYDSITVTGDRAKLSTLDNLLVSTWSFFGSLGAGSSTDGPTPSAGVSAGPEPTASRGPCRSTAECVRDCVHKGLGQAAAFVTGLESDARHYLVGLVGVGGAASLLNSPTAAGVSFGELAGGWLGANYAVRVLGVSTVEEVVPIAAAGLSRGAALTQIAVGATGFIAGYGLGTVGYCTAQCAMYSGFSYPSF